MRTIEDRRAEISGVVAAPLGGSRATGAHDADPDCDFGLYPRAPSISTMSSRWVQLATCSRPARGGRVVNGGAWLEIDGSVVDWSTATFTRYAAGQRLPSTDAWPTRR